MLSAIPDRVEPHVLLWLGEQCIKHNSIKDLMQIFKVMAASRIEIKRKLYWPAEEKYNNKSEIDTNFCLLGDYYSLNEIWIKGLKNKFT